MNRVSIVLVSALLLQTGQSASADIEVYFVESAPKDRFSITNIGECILEDLVLEIDLAESAGKLIFDTSATGAGVDVFQPFEITEGSIYLVSTAGVADGDTRLSMGIERLEPGQTASFTIDVDDQLPASALGQTRISAAEIEGGLVRARWRAQAPVIATFGSDRTATARLCSATQLGGG